MAKKKSAKHTKYSFQDQQAVGLVSAWIAETKRAMPDIKANDKWPNIDGYIELTDSEGYPIGNVKVQIKKLSKKNAKSLKHRFKNDKFLSYCRETTDWIPIIFIGVDLDKNTAYWVHIDDALLSSLGSSGKTINLNDKDIISQGDDSFVNKWLEILDDYSTKSSKFEEYKKSYSILADIVTPALGISRDYFINIHVFLDSLNDSLEKDFPIVKQFYYPNIWKLGLAYYKYTGEELAYTIYPIAHDKNDVQIKEIDKYIHDKVQAQGLGFTGHFRENPIAVNPIKYSYTVLESKLKEVLQLKALNHTGNEFLAKEFVFAFVDNFHTQLGLEIKDEYSLEEIQFGYNVYMPIWIEESLKFMVSINRNNIKERIIRRPIDPDSMLNEIMLEERVKIKDIIERRIKNEELETRSYITEHNKLPFRTFVEFSKYLQAAKVKEVKRLYKKKDFDRLRKLNSNYVYNVHSKEDVIYNFGLFLENLQPVFNTLINNNFPKLRNSIKLWHGANKVLIYLELKSQYVGMDSPRIHMIFLNSDDDEVSVELIKDESEWDVLKKASSYENIQEEKLIEYNGKSYSINKPTFSSSSVFDFIYSETPMFDFINDSLESAFSKYFRTRVYERRN